MRMNRDETSPDSKTEQQDNYQPTLEFATNRKRRRRAQMMQRKQQNTIHVNPISKYLRDEGNVKSTENITRHIEVQRNDEADLETDWRTMVQVDPE